MVLNSVWGMFSNDLAIDTRNGEHAHLRRARGSCVTSRPWSPSRRRAKGGRKVLAVGGRGEKDAWPATPGNIVAIRPLKDGVIADFEITEAMLRYFIQKIHNRKTLVGRASSSACPSASPRSRKRAVKESAESAGRA